MENERKEKKQQQQQNKKNSNNDYNRANNIDIKHLQRSTCTAKLTEIRPYAKLD